jgi:hypothetical protein
VDKRSRPRRISTAIFSIVTIVALGFGGVAIYRSVTANHAPYVCLVNVGGGVTYTLDADQAVNATTITAVGKRIGLPDHAVTVALAAAFQESKLHNLSHGDRDSLGLFQQRPSQGWGTASQVQDPVYAATAFFTHLAKVNGWEQLPVTTAAQDVQHSGAPDAYANWEAEARAVARATTGEVPAALSCRSSSPNPSTVDPALQSTMTVELGAVDLTQSLPAAQGWTVASWLVAHAPRFGITMVTFDGKRWTPSSARWAAHSPAVLRVEIQRLAA